MFCRLPEQTRILKRHSSFIRLMSILYPGQCSGFARRHRCPLYQGTASHHYANLGLRKLSFKPMIFQYLHAFSIDMRDGKRRLFQSIRSNLFLLPGYARGDGLARTTWKREFTIRNFEFLASNCRPPYRALDLPES